MTIRVFATGLARPALFERIAEATVSPLRRYRAIQARIDGQIAAMRAEGRCLACAAEPAVADGDYCPACTLNGGAAP